MSNYMPSKFLDEITYSFPNFTGATDEVWEWMSNVAPYFIMDTCDYLSMLGLKLTIQ